MSPNELGSSADDPVGPIEFRDSPALDDAALQTLYRSSREGYPELSWRPVLERSLGWIAAFHHHTLIGFVNVAWDGRLHAFLMDPVVLPRNRRRGVGTELVRRAARLAQRRGCHWLHVDYEPQHDGFYRDACGFVPTAAGLLNLLTSRL